MRFTEKLRRPSSCLVAVLLLAAGAAGAAEKAGAAGALRSAGPIAFGAGGVLFVADTQAAAIVAFETGDAKKADKIEAAELADIGAKVAALLGTEAQQVLITDLAVNPSSGKVYLSAARGRGPDALPAIIRVDAGGKLAVVDTDKLPASRVELPDAPAAGGEGQGQGRRGSQRQESITDLALVDGKLLVTGLSNEEFASSMRSIPYPFSKLDKGTSVEIYHGAHGRFETRSPVRTFTTFDFAGKTHVVAAYTCTPLVRFAVADLKPGAHLKGTTIAELGNRNRPLDMISYTKGGEDWFLMANSARGIMKIPAKAMDKAASITEPVSGGGKQGVGYETIEGWKGIEQLDRLDAERAVVLEREESGTLNLKTLALP